MPSRRTFLATATAASGLGLWADQPSARADQPAPDPTGPLAIRDVRIHELTARDNKAKKALYLEVVSESGESGWSGSLFPETCFLIRHNLRPLLIGKDAMANEAVWDTLKLSDRHSRAGLFMMAMSAVDIAIWDLRGKHLGLPVYRLLGGPIRTTIPVYASMLGYSTAPDEARKAARSYFDRGFTAQKWFFDYGPADGADGRAKNLALVRVLREELGDGANLMFDCKWAWDVSYAIAFAKAIQKYAPKWLEEPVRSENVDAYIAIKRDGGVPLAAGEHLYTRWEVKRYLDAGALDYVQADPEWTGGITELVKICALSEVYGVPVVPHGHHIWAALHVIASRPARVCPMAEFLFQYMADKQYFEDTIIKPEKGQVALPTAPGLGFSIDPTKVGDRRELKWD